MPLPIPNQTWPPETWKDQFDRYAEASAWYSGDPVQLSNYYAIKSYTPTPKGRFWAKDISEKRRVMLHVPLAQDIARTSSNLLFSEAPEIVIPESGERTDAGLPVNADADAAQARLFEILERNNFNALLMEAADTAAGMSGVFLKVNWDADLADYPIFSTVQVDAAIPEFSFGILRAVTFFRVVAQEDDVVWRHIERHEPGVILNGLYRSDDDDSLGAVRPLTDQPETAGLLDVVRTGVQGLCCRYVPNCKPNRRTRGSALGQADYAGAYTLLDSLDETWTSWMRDIRIGVGRVFVDESMLETDSSGTLQFDIDKEAFVKLSQVGSVGGTVADQIAFNQFEIRAEQHQATCDALVREIIGRCGYAPQSFGLDVDGAAESGTALRMRERKSLTTAAGKSRYWQTAIADLLEIALQIDVQQFRSGIVPARPAVEIQDSVISSDVELADSLQKLSLAAAISTEIKVRKLHPEWDDDQVRAEVERIQAEQGTAVPDALQLGAV